MPAPCCHSKTARSWVELDLHVQIQAANLPNKLGIQRTTEMWPAGRRAQIFCEYPTGVEPLFMCRLVCATKNLGTQCPAGVGFTGCYRCSTNEFSRLVSRHWPSVSCCPMRVCARTHLEMSVSNRCWSRGVLPV